MHAATPSNKADGTPYTPALLPRAGLFLPGLPAMFGTLPHMSFGQWSIYHTPPIFLLHNNSVLCNFQYKFSHFFVNFFRSMFLTVKNGLIFKAFIKLIVQNKTAQHLGYVSSLQAPLPLPEQAWGQAPERRRQAGAASQQAFLSRRACASPDGTSPP